MKQSYFLLVVLAAAALCSQFTPAACVHESEILQFLEELRMRMCHPIPNLGLPALDPLHIKDFDTAVDNQYIIDFTGSVADFNLYGLSDFKVNSLALQTDPVRTSVINVTFPLTWFKSVYTAKGSLGYILNLAGDGNAEASIEMFTFSISWKLKVGFYLGIKNLQIDMHLGGLKIDFENLLEEDRINDFVHALVNELGVELLDDFWSYEQDSVISAIQTRINDIIGNYTLTDIIKYITSGGGGEPRPPAFDGVEPDCKPNALV